MGRLYVAKGVEMAITGAVTLVQIVAGSAGIIKIHRAWVAQSSTTTSAQKRIQLLRKTAAATVTSTTPLLFDPGDAAADAIGGAALTGHTATAEGTDGNVLIDDVFNVLSGWLYLPTPEERPIVGPSGIIALKFPAASTLTVTAGFIFEEIGG